MDADSAQRSNSKSKKKKKKNKAAGSPVKQRRSFWERIGFRRKKTPKKHAKSPSGGKRLKKSGSRRIIKLQQELSRGSPPPKAKRASVFPKNFSELRQRFDSQDNNAPLPPVPKKKTRGRSRGKAKPKSRRRRLRARPSGKSTDSNPEPCEPSEASTTDGDSKHSEDVVATMADIPPPSDALVGQSSTQSSSTSLDIGTDVEPAGLDRLPGSQDDDTLDRINPHGAGKLKLAWGGAGKGSKGRPKSKPKAKPKAKRSKSGGKVTKKKGTKKGKKTKSPKLVPAATPATPATESFDFDQFDRVTSSAAKAATKPVEPDLPPLPPAEPAAASSSSTDISPHKGSLSVPLAAGRRDSSFHPPPPATHAKLGAPPAVAVGIPKRSRAATTLRSSSASRGAAGVLPPPPSSKKSPSLRTRAATTSVMTGSPPPPLDDSDSSGDNSDDSSSDDDEHVVETVSEEELFQHLGVGTAGPRLSRSATTAPAKSMSTPALVHAGKDDVDSKDDAMPDPMGSPLRTRSSTTLTETVKRQARKSWLKVRSKWQEAAVAYSKRDRVKSVQRRGGRQFEVPNIVKLMALLPEDEANNIDLNSEPERSDSSSLEDSDEEFDEEQEEEEKAQQNGPAASLPQETTKTDDVKTVNGAANSAAVDANGTDASGAASAPAVSSSAANDTGSSPAAPKPKSRRSSVKSRRASALLTPEERKKRKEESRKIKRTKVRREIIDTESSYVASLQMLKDEFADPLKSAAATSKWISFQDVINIFSNVESILTFHTILLADLQKNQHASEVINKYADYLKAYTLYLNGYETCLRVVNRLATNKKFQKFLATKREKCGNDLMSFLIMPVQRIPRYVLLLSELKHYTTEDDPEFPILVETLDKVRAIAEHVNEYKRQVETMSKLLEIQNRLSGGFSENLLQPHRRLLFESEAKKLVPAQGLFKSAKLRDRVIFLFSDIIMWVNASKHKYKDHYQLTDVRVSTDCDQTWGPAFKITDEAQIKVVVFVATDEKKRNKLVNVLNLAIENRKKEVKDLQLRRTVRGPNFASHDSIEEEPEKELAARLAEEDEDEKTPAQTAAAPVPAPTTAPGTSSAPPPASSAASPPPEPVAADPAPATVAVPDAAHESPSLPPLPPPEDADAAPPPLPPP